MRSCHHRRMATDPPFRSPCVLRRDVLIGGAVGAAVVLAPRLRARGAVPADLDRGIRELMAAGRLPGLSAAVVRGGEVEPDVRTRSWTTRQPLDQLLPHAGILRAPTRPAYRATAPGIAIRDSSAATSSGAEAIGQ